MAISLVNSKTGSTPSASSLVLDLTTFTWQTDDVLILFVSSGGPTAPTISSSSPSTTFTTHYSASHGGSLGVAVFFRTLTAGQDINSVTLTTGGGQPTTVVAAQFRGWKTSDGLTSAVSTGSTNNPDSPSLLNGSSISAYISFGAAVSADSAATAPSGYTSIGYVMDAFLSASATGVAWKNNIAAGATENPGAWSLWTVDDNWAALTIRISQAVTASDQTLTHTTTIASGDAIPPTGSHAITSTYALTQTATVDDSTNDAIITPIIVSKEGALDVALVPSDDDFFGPTVDLLDKFLEAGLLFDPDAFIRPFVDIVTPLVATVPAARTGSRTILLVEIDAVDEDGDPNTLRYATDGLTSVEEGTTSRAHYAPRIIDPGNFEQIMFDPTTPFQGSSSGIGDIQITAAPAARDGASTDALLSMGVDGRQFSVYEIQSKRTPKSQWELRLRGQVDFLVSDDAYNRLGFKIRDVLRAYETPLLTEEFGGTTVGGGLGTVDGDAPLAGVKKQNCYGEVFNVEGQPANPYDLVFLFSNRGCYSLVVKDGGANLTNGGDFASLAGMMAWLQVPGQYVTYLAGGLARLGSSPTGAVTADVQTEALDADMSAGQLVRQILDETYQFITTTTSDNLLTNSPDTLTAINASITGTGPFKIVENGSSPSSVEHLARSQTITKEARSVAYTFIGEFDFDPRGLVIRIGNSDQAFAGLIIPGEDDAGIGDPSFATSTEEGGYAVVSFEINQIDADWWEARMVFSSNSATSLYIDLVLAQTDTNTRQHDQGDVVVVDFDTEYSGNGTSGVKYRNLSLTAQIAINTDLFDQLDAKNPAVCGLLATGDMTILDACQLLLGSIGAWLLPSPFGELQTGRFDFPPAIPSNTNELIVGSPDAQWGTVNCSIVGDLIRESVSGADFHYIVATWMKVAEKLRYRFVGEFKAAGRVGIEFILSTTTTGCTLVFNISTGAMTYRASGADFGKSSTIEFADIAATTGGYYQITIEFTSDDQSPVQVLIAMSTDGTPSGTLYAGDGTSGVQFRNLSFKAVDPSVATISEDIILGDSLERRPTGDQGRGIPYWKVRTNYARNWRVQQGTEVLPVVANATRARLGQEWISTEAVSSTATRNTHPGSIELVTDTYLANATDAAQENQRRFELFGRTRASYRCEVPDRYAVDLQLGDMVTLIATRFGLDEGQIMTVVGIVYDLERRTTTLTLWG